MTTYTTGDVIDAFGTSTIIPDVNHNHAHYAFALPPPRDQPRPGVRGKDRVWTLADVCIYLTALELLPAFSQTTIVADAVKMLRELLDVEDGETWVFRSCVIIRHDGAWGYADSEEALWLIPDGVTTVLSIAHIEQKALAGLAGKGTE